MDWLKRILRNAIMPYKNIFGSLGVKSYLMVNLGGPLFQMICFTLIASYANGNTNTTYWFIGNALVMTYFNAIFGVGSQLSAEKSYGTLLLLIASPTNRMSIFMPRAILHIFDSLGTVLIGFLVGSLLFGFTLPLIQLPAFILAILVAAFSAMAFGLLISSLGLLTRDLNLILNIASMGLLGLTGANFPITYMPKWLQGISQLTPLTRSIEVCRALQNGVPLSSNVHLLIGEFLVGLGILCIGFIVFTFIERLAIKKGVLELL